MGMSIDLELQKLGVLSFARFYDLTIEEAVSIINSPNDTFYEMMTEITQSMMRVEHFMVKIKKCDEDKEDWTRLDFLDFEQ